MKRGFTLVELMIVIAVVVSLMAITFRITNAVGDAEARTITITRMQRLENALSGFHAAFGCYPPVKLHGNRSFRDQEESINWGNEREAWYWVEKICRTQPVGCRFPFSADLSGFIRECSDIAAAAAASGQFTDTFEPKREDGTRDPTRKNWAQAGFSSAAESHIEGELSTKKDEVLWSEIKLFQYGVMSYLLPRYYIMMGGDRKYFTSGYAQWTANNDKPCDPFTGEPIEWSTVYDWAQQWRKGDKNENVIKLQMVPSQAVCARWLPNLENICDCGYIFKPFGVALLPEGSKGILGTHDNMGGLVSKFMEATCTPDNNTNNKDQYVLDEVTIKDGWGHEFYYYSRSPYQSYTLWSAGPDGKTFPPWIARDQLSGQELDLAAKWTKDDIAHMSN